MLNFAGPNQIPQEFLDVYFQPLYDELLELWHGVSAVDGSISHLENQNFILHAILLCTMHDWPGKCVLYFIFLGS